MSHDSIISSFTTDSASSTAQGGTDLVDIVPHSPLKDICTQQCMERKQFQEMDLKSFFPSAI